MSKNLDLEIAAAERRQEDAMAKCATSKDAVVIAMIEQFRKWVDDPSIAKRTMGGMPAQLRNAIGALANQRDAAEAEQAAGVRALSYMQRVSEPSEENPGAGVHRVEAAYACYSDAAAAVHAERGAITQLNVQKAECDVAGPGVKP